MNIPDELQAEFTALAAKIWERGYQSGYEHGVMVFATPPTYGVTCIANIASHIAGTEAPQGETWDEMRARELASGAK